MFDNLPGFIWFDGAVIPWQEARIHVMTHGLHYATSVYEGLRSYNNKLFKAQMHYERLLKSANYLDFQIPYSAEELVTATEHLLNKGNYTYAYARTIAWCGSKKMSVSHNGADVHTAIGIWERAPINNNSGIRMNIAEWRRPDPKTAPVHSKAAALYATSAMSKRSSELLGFDDALVLDYEGYIAEATSSNIFFVINDELYTPTPDCFLNGITRLTCLDIVQELGIKTYETKLTLDDLHKAQEVFLTGTAVEILPVNCIKGHGKTWHFKPGGITNAIRAKFQNIINNL